MAPRPLIFQLPSGYRPDPLKQLALTVLCSGAGSCEDNEGLLLIFGTGLGAEFDGSVVIGATTVSLDGISFRAGS